MHNNFLHTISNYLFHSKQQIFFLLIGVVFIQCVIFVRKNYKSNIHIDGGVIAIGSAHLLLFLRGYFRRMGSFGETLSNIGVGIFVLVVIIPIYQFIRQYNKNLKSSVKQDRIIRTPRNSSKIQRKKIIFFLLRLVISSGLLIALILTY